MFCPKCRVEYRDGFTVCADCDVPLVAVLPVGPEEPDGQGPDELDVEFTDLEPVYVSFEQSDVLLARSMLESANIACFVDSGTGLTYTGFGRILVRPDDVEAALSILETMVRPDDEAIQNLEFPD